MSTTESKKRITDLKRVFRYKILPGVPVAVEDTLESSDDVRALHNDEEVPVD